jgi:hypothetical protein
MCAPQFFFERWPAQAELHADSSTVPKREFWEFPQTPLSEFSKFLIAFTQCFPGFRAMSFGNFLLSQPVLGIFASSGRQV